MNNQTTSNQQGIQPHSSSNEVFPDEKIRQICLEEGADDVGFVEINRAALGMVKGEALSIYPKTKTIISICKSGNRENLQSTSRAIANQESHDSIYELSDVARQIVRRLNDLGIRGVTCHPAFPQDSNRWPGKIWEISHKPIAEQAGIGRIGINRLVLHPKYGSTILLASILIDAELDKYSEPIEYNPCVSCHLCVAACPVGAISATKPFDFNACMTHNYRDFMGGFQDWIENVIESKNVREYRSYTPDGETLSKWQSLSYGPQYKASRCVAVCPAGEDVFSIYKNDKNGWGQQIVKPLIEKEESVYVQQGTRAEEHVRRNQHKQVQIIRNVIRPNSIEGFLNGTRIAFETKRAKDVKMTVHFVFTGKENILATIKIKDQTINVTNDLEGNADLKVLCDSKIWLGIINKEISILGILKAVITKKMQVKGGIKLLRQFQGCFLT